VVVINGLQHLLTSLASNHTMSILAGVFFSVRQRLSNPLARNASFVLVGQTLTLVVQFVYFIAIARTLGPLHYGAFIAVLALAQAISPFVGLGHPQLLIRSVSRDRGALSECWGNLLSVTLTSGLIATGLLAAVAPYLLPTIGLAVLLPVVASEFILYKIVECASAAFQSLERMELSARLSVTCATMRLIGVVALSAADAHPTAQTWSLTYFAATAASSIIAVGLASRHVGRPSIAFWRIRTEFTDGLYFALTNSAWSVFNDIDKTMLARLANAEAAGTYAAAYRLTEVSLMPVKALATAAYPGFFRHGKHGITSGLHYAQRFLFQAVAYSTVAFAGLVLLAPWLTYALGNKYASSVEAVKWLAIIPIIRSAHIFLADLLSGSGHQGLRAIAQVLAAIVNVILNVWLITAFSWKGAAWASVCAELTLALVLGVTVFTLRWRENRRSTWALERADVSAS
jgi:O-antigen/teichoic acid export membrane protein